MTSGGGAGSWTEMFSFGGGLSDCVPVESGLFKGACIQRGGLLDRATGGRFTEGREGYDSQQLAAEAKARGPFDGLITPLMDALGDPIQRIGLVLIGAILLGAGVFVLAKGSVTDVAKEVLT